MNLRASRSSGGENIILAGGPLDGSLIEIPTYIQQREFVDIPLDAAAKGLGLPIPEMLNPPRLYLFVPKPA